MGKRKKGFLIVVFVVFVFLLEDYLQFKRIAVKMGFSRKQMVSALKVVDEVYEISNSEDFEIKEVLREMSELSGGSLKLFFDQMKNSIHNDREMSTLRSIWYLQLLQKGEKSSDLEEKIMLNLQEDLSFFLELQKNMQEPGSNNFEYLIIKLREVLNEEE